MNQNSENLSKATLDVISSIQQLYDEHIADIKELAEWQEQWNLNPESCRMRVLEENYTPPQAPSFQQIFHLVSAIPFLIERIKKDNQQLVKKEDYNQPYGYCPICSIPGMSRERRINGNDMCFNGHIYLSRDAVYPK